MSRCFELAAIFSKSPWKSFKLECSYHLLKKKNQPNCRYSSLVWCFLFHVTPFASPGKVHHMSQATETWLSWSGNTGIWNPIPKKTKRIGRRYNSLSRQGIDIKVYGKWSVITGYRSDFGWRRRTLSTSLQWVLFFLQNVLCYGAILHCHPLATSWHILLRRQIGCARKLC